jgi:hypothetical protein
VMAVRERIRLAAQARDAAALRAVYAAGFTHTHGSGRVDGRDARIVAILAGEPVIELAPVEEITIRVPHADTAIVTGRGPVLNAREGRTYDFRWVQVYVRVGGDWQLAVSQATRLGPTAEAPRRHRRAARCRRRPGRTLRSPARPGSPSGS